MKLSIVFEFFALNVTFMSFQPRFSSRFPQQQLYGVDCVPRLAQFEQERFFVFLTMPQISGGATGTLWVGTVRNGTLRIGTGFWTETVHLGSEQTLPRPRPLKPCQLTILNYLQECHQPFRSVKNDSTFCLYKKYFRFRGGVELHV